ncbi:ATP-binding protein [Rapidithrix thailandica]|uniref:histidine kinase n=1 Tax=Rapidithrix thailandica TaxID=413964 RepID=A0AAW9RYK5_9BACT
MNTLTNKWGKALWVCIILHFVTLTLYAQEPASAAQDSLMTSAKATELLHMAEEAFRQADYDRALQYSEQARKGIHQFSFQKLRAKSFLITARAYQQKKLLGSALKFYLRSLKEAELLKDSLSLYQTYNELGNLYQEWDLLKKALDYHVLAYQIRPETQEQPQTIALLQTISYLCRKVNIYESAIHYDLILHDLYSNQQQWQKAQQVLTRIRDAYAKLEDYPTAIGYNHQILEINMQQSDTLQLTNSLLDLAYLYKDNGELEKSITYFSQYFAFVTRYENTQGPYPYLNKLIDGLVSVGILHKDLGEKNKRKTDYFIRALSFLGMASKHCEKGQRKKELAEIYYYISSIYYKLKNYQSAEIYGNNALHIAKKYGDQDILSLGYIHMAEMYQDKFEFKKALDYYTLHSQLKDSLLNKELEEKREALRRETTTNQKQFISNKREQMILDEEMKGLILKKLQLESESYEKELAILQREKTLQQYALQNEQLQKEKAQQQLTLAQQALEAEKRERELYSLQKNKQLQDLALKQIQLEKQERLRTIELLKKEKEIRELEFTKNQLELNRARTQRYAFIGIILFITIILILALYNYNLSKKANIKLAKQKRVIEKKHHELVELNQEKNHLISILAHDLRNPLAISISLLNFLHHQSKNFSLEQIKSIHLIQRSLSRMNEMIAKILDVRAIESQKLNITLSKTDLTSLIQQVCKQFAEALEEKKIRLYCQWEVQETYALADEHYLYQVFENLLSNAIKFSQPESAIEVRLKENTGKLRAEFCDHGPGINEKDMAKLFGKFQKLSAKPTSGEQSIGLGLSIVKKYTEAMHGRVWCESEEGQGATFIVELDQCAEPLVMNSDQKTA